MFVSLFSGRGVALVSVAVVFLLGWLRAPESAVQEPLIARLPPCVRIVQGNITSPLVRLQDRSQMVIALEKCSACLTGKQISSLSPSTGKLIVSISEDAPDIYRRGDTVRFRAVVRPIAPRRNPGQPMRQNTTPLLFAAVERSAEIAHVQTGSFSLQYRFDLIRDRLAAFWKQALPAREANLARALTLGESAVLFPSQRLHFRRTGTAHLLAVSGLHLGLLVLITFGVWRCLLLWMPAVAARDDVGRSAALLTIPPAIAYAFLAGCRPPVVRASVMAVSALTGRALGRHSGTLEALAVAGGALLVFEPALLLDPGFELSFVSVLTFLWVLGRGRTREKTDPEPAGTGRLKKWPERLKTGVVDLGRSCLAAAAATTPLVLYHFNYVSLAAVPLNLVAVPLTSFLILPGALFINLIAGPAPCVAAALAQPLGAALGGLDRLLGFVSQLPCTIENPGPIGAVGITAACVSVLLLLIRRRAAGNWGLVGAAAIIGASFFADPPRLPREALTVDFLDVGHGDSALITFPNRKHWLVDAGGSQSSAFDFGEQVVVPALRALGVTELDALVLTHPDPDHVGGMTAVINSFEVGRVLENGQGEAEGAHERYHSFVAAARARGIPIHRPPGICNTSELGGVRITVLHPCHQSNGYDPTLSFNDNSLVLLLRYGNAAYLLTGDVGSEAEKTLVQRGAIPKVDVLKVPHHGSRSSSSALLLDAASPAICVASVGLWNRFGMPHREVKKRLTARGISLWRTDKAGAIRLTTDGRIIKAQSFDSKGLSQ